MPAYRHFMLEACRLPDCVRGAVSLLRDIVGVQSGDCLIDTIPECLRRVLRMGGSAVLHRALGIHELWREKPDDDREDDNNQQQNRDTSSVVSRGFLLSFLKYLHHSRYSSVSSKFACCAFIRAAFFLVRLSMGT